MNPLFFFLKDRHRFRILLKFIAIGFPLLIAIGVATNYYEDWRDANGTPNDKGGITYRYRGSSGTDKIPEAVTAVVPNYPDGIATYIAIGTDKDNNPDGDIYFFTKDSFAKVKDFYKKLDTVTLDTDDLVTIQKGSNQVSISKSKIQEDDVYKDGTMFSVSIHKPGKSYEDILKDFHK